MIKSCPMTYMTRPAVIPNAIVQTRCMRQIDNRTTSMREHQLVWIDTSTLTLLPAWGRRMGTEDWRDG